jgi:arsenate reductase (thioredoxin)
MKKRILVLCVGNSCRSQIAEGYMQYFAIDKAEVFSAGVETHGVNPKAILVMKEDGLDISHHTSNHVDEYQNETFHFVLTVCENGKDRCPYFPALEKQFHQNFPDPAQAVGTPDEILNEFRKVRDDIKKYCEGFVKKNLP